MKVFVKYYRVTSGTIPVNSWCDVTKKKYYSWSEYRINSGELNGFHIIKDEFLTVKEYRKQKINKILNESCVC